MGGLAPLCRGQMLGIVSSFFYVFPLMAFSIAPEMNDYGAMVECNW